MKRRPRLRPMFLLTIGLVALAMLASGCAAPKPSRLPDPEDVKALLVQLVDVEKVTAPACVRGG